MEPKILTYRDDPRVKSNHFILSEINRAFMEKHGIEGMVEDFKERVRNSRYEFKAVTGNTKKGTQRTKVYDINKFIQKAPEIVAKLDALLDEIDAKIIPGNLNIQDTEELSCIVGLLIRYLIIEFTKRW